MSRSMKLWGVVAVVLSLAGCRCNRPSTDTGLGEPGIIYEQNGVRITSAEGFYDFAQVSMGVSKTLKLTITNNGRGPFSITSLTQVDGADEVQIAPMLSGAPTFQVQWPGSVEVAIGQQIEFDVVFNAPRSADPSITTTDHRAVLSLAFTSATVDTASVTLTGIAVSGTCDLPRTLDFGAVALGDTFGLTVPFVNQSPLDTIALAGDISSNSGDQANFGYGAMSKKGSFPLKAGATENVVVEFKPTEPREYLALAKMRAAEACPEFTVRLTGQGVADVLTWVPPDFGYVQPGLSVTADVTFENLGFAAVELTQLATVAGSSSGPTASAEYKLNGVTSLTVPAATRVEMNGVNQLVPGRVTLPVTFAPTVLGRREASLTAKTTLPRQANIAVPLNGFGGGPDIDVKPSPLLNFGKVAYFTAAETGGPQYFVTRKLTIRNAGTRPPMPDAKANLHLGQKLTAPYANGTTEKWWSVVPKAGTAAQANEICVGRWDGVQGCLGDLATPSSGGQLDNQVGIPAGEAKSVIDVPVRLMPADDGGNKEWELTIYSNDPDEGSLVVTIKADAVRVPPCNFTVTPTTLNFGLVTPPNSRDLAFNIKNNGTAANQVCLLNGLDLKTGSDPLFSLPNDPIDFKELQPGEDQNVLVRAWPQGTASSTVQTATGAVHFSISSPTQPERDVNLQASIATSCLTIAPNDLDFGTVKKDCSSARRTFNLYNTCASAITINSFGVQAGAGEPAGGPNCPGVAPCPEFLQDGTPGFMPGTSIPAGSSTPLQFALKYHPINYGDDNGAYVITVTQNGQVVDYLVTLRGRGDMTGTNTDIFRQDLHPKADLLLVIDDSCSMADKQAALAANFASFISYPSTNQIDYHIGVITTGLGATDEGKLRGDMNNPKVLDPSLPNVEQLFKSKVTVGIGLNGDEGIAQPALKALTAPLITTDNAGFLRADAVLAVVGVTDAAEHSTAPAAVYETQFRNIKGAQRPNLFTYNIIGPFVPTPPPNCSYDEAQPDVSKHQYLTGRFNGVRAEICATDWATTLQALGKTAFGYRTNFYLTAEPIAGTLQVKIEGISIPQVDSRGSTVWTYDAVTNSVNFEPLYLPEPGNTLTVSYQVQCSAN